MSTGSTGSFFPKWQLALLIAAPTVIGVGYYIYRKNQSGNVSDDGEKAKEPTKSNGLDSKTIEKSKPKEVLSPLAEAQDFKNEGNRCYRNGKYDEAIEFYDKAIEKCPAGNIIDLSIFHQNRAAAYEMLGKWNNVIDDCSKSIEYNSRYAKAYFRRAKAYEANNDLLESLNDITATCILEVFQNNNTIMFADRILKLTGQIDATKAMKTRIPVLPSTSFINTYLRSFVMDPLVLKEIPKVENPKGFIKAKIEWKSGRFENIIPACTEDIESTEDESEYKSEALLLRGTFYLLSGCYDESLQDLNAIINNEEIHVDLRCNALIKRAALYAQTDDKEMCLKDFDTAEKLNPNNADIYQQRAQTFILLDKMEEAIKEFEKAINLAPDHAVAIVQKSYAEYRFAVLKEDQIHLMMAIEQLKNAIEKYPDCIDCYSLMAQLLIDQRQFDQADQFYLKAIQLAPDNASLYVHRGILYLQWTGNVEKAVELMYKSLEIDEKCELAYETLGTIEVQRANLSKAVELFEKAVKLAKSHAEVSHVFALRNAALAQINVTKKLKIDMQALSSLSSAGLVGPN